MVVLGPFHLLSTKIALSSYTTVYTHKTLNDHIHDHNHIDDTVLSLSAAIDDNLSLEGRKEKMRGGGGET